MRLLMGLGLIVLSSVCLAQSTDRIRVTVGYGSTGDFVNKNDKTVNIVGPEIGLELPFTKIGPVELTFAPSVFLGGRLSHSKDSDGDVYRYLLLARMPVGKEGAYVLAGGGYAHSFDRASQFDAVNGTVGRFGVGFPVRLGPLSSFKPAIEISVYAGPNGQLRGTFFSLNGKI